ncbi:MAG TPA: sulfotransferase [Acetobacteraceae bacterium]|nr:sulfotransferase [Acetobacteraceae bacterium]
MRLADIPSARVVLLLGAPRSGTSWLAKIFDGHPDVLCRHEPDTVLRTSDLTWMCPRDQVDAHVDQARFYLRQLFEIATLRTTGSQPMFPERFESTPVRLLRAGIIDVLRAADLTMVGRQLIRQAHIPDFLALDRHPDLRLVVKSVSSRGRARRFAEALPEARIIVTMRDPWGQVASMQRGSALGKFEDKVPVGELLETEQAARCGLTETRFATLPSVEQFACNWAILNAKAIEDLGGLERVKLLKYQDLCEHPVARARALLDFAGLGWEPQTEPFLRRSISDGGPDRYYAVFRNTAAALYRWRQDLSADDQRRINDVVQATSLASLCPSLEP